MVTDERTSREPVSDNVELEAGETSAIFVLPVDTDVEISVDYVKVEYSDNGTAEAAVNLQDIGVQQDNPSLDNPEDVFYLMPGEETVLEEVTYDDFENGVGINGDGNNDAAITVTIGGYVVGR